MKLLIVRHADPDYSIDSLTPRGWQEAELLADRFVGMPVTDFFVSPLGRARDTAGVTLKKIGREAETLEWLREFPAKVLRPDCDTPKCAWDWLPRDWMTDGRFFDPVRWREHSLFEQANVGALYDGVCERFDDWLAARGYVRTAQRFYRAERANMDTFVFFCHFGIECVLLSRLLGVSPMPLWHGLCAAPTSVTTVYTEEREKGFAAFRASTFGDVSHLYAKGVSPAFSARFCECYDNADEPHGYDE